MQRRERRTRNLAVFVHGEPLDARSRRAKATFLRFGRHGSDVLVLLLADVGQLLDRDAVLSEERLGQLERFSVDFVAHLLDGG